MNNKLLCSFICCLSLSAGYAAYAETTPKTDAEAWNLLQSLNGMKPFCCVPVKNNSFQLIRAKNAGVWIQPSRTDFSPYNAIAFDIETNGKPGSGGEMGVVMHWKNPDKRVNSYFFYRMPVSFSGKKQIIIPFGDMSRNRNPELNPISRVSFITTGWGLKVDKDFIATIGNVRLLKFSPEELKKLNPDKKPVVNFRKMVYPNLCGVTKEEVKKIATMLPDKPGLPGGNIHERKFWSRYPVCDYLVKRAESRNSRKPPHYSWQDWDRKKPWPQGSLRGFIQELERYLAGMTPLECKENKGRFIQRISETLESFMDNPVGAGHTNLWDPDLTKIRRKGYRYVELNNAVWMSDMATTYWLLDDKLPADVRKRVKAYIDEWMFSPMFLNLSQPHSSGVARLNYGTWAMRWINGINNWNPFCSFYVLYCTHAMLESKEERAYLTASMIRSMAQYLNSLTETGYITEGVGYWKMGFGAYLQSARLLYALTDGKLDLLAKAPAKVYRSTYIARDMMMAPGGLYPHFADYGQLGKATPFWDKELDLMNQAFGEDIYNVKEKYNPVNGVFFCGDYFYTMLQISWQKELKKVPGPKLYFWDPEAQVLVARDNPKAKVPLSFAFKGGNNHELHNHNDVGSFVVGIGKAIHLGDPGVGSYNVDRKVSASRSLIHPVPIPNGVEQGEGWAYKGKVLAVENDNLHSMVHLDCKAAYFPDADLKKLDRKVVYDREKRLITITDCCELNKPGTYELPLPSFEEFKNISPGVWTLGRLRIEIKGIGGELEYRLQKPQVKLRTQKGFTMLVCKFKGKVKSCGIRLKITPLEESNK